MYSQNCEKNCLIDTNVFIVVVIHRRMYCNKWNLVQIYSMLVANHLNNNWRWWGHHTDRKVMYTRSILPPSSIHDGMWGSRETSCDGLANKKYRIVKVTFKSVFLGIQFLQIFAFVLGGVLHNHSHSNHYQLEKVFKGYRGERGCGGQCDQIWHNFAIMAKNNAFATKALGRILNLLWPVSHWYLAHLIVVMKPNIELHIWPSGHTGGGWVVHVQASHVSLGK